MKKTFRVLVVDGDKNVRQKLVDYYFERLKHRYAPKARNIVCKAKDVLDAQRKNPNLHLVIFSLEFPESEKKQLREWLSDFVRKITFITVPLQDLGIIDKSTAKI